MISIIKPSLELYHKVTLVEVLYPYCLLNHD